MRVGIIGGGLMGLALAEKLGQQGIAVSVFEQEAQPGGLATYKDYGPFVWDKFYHVILPTDNSLLQLLEDIGLANEIQWRPSSAGYYTEGGFYPFSSILDFLRFPGLNYWQKLRLAWTIYYGSRISDSRKMEAVSVDDWLKRVGGKTTFKRFWKPLLLAKLGPDYPEVSAVFIWTYIKRLFEARKTPAHKEHMGYVAGGYKKVFDTYLKLLQQQKAKVHFRTQVTKIATEAGDGIHVSFKQEQEGDKQETFDKVIFTAPNPVLRKVVDSAMWCQRCPKELPAVSQRNSNSKQENIEYLGVICMTLVTRNGLSPYYVLNLADSSLPFTGVIGMSTLVALKETGGQHLTYFPKYLKRNHFYWQKTDIELREIFLQGVRRLFPGLSDEEITGVHIHRAPVVQPLQVLNYSEKIPRIKTEHPDFFILNTSQFDRDTLNNNSVARHVFEFMETIGARWSPQHTAQQNKNTILEKVPHE